MADEPMVTLQIRLPRELIDRIDRYRLVQLKTLRPTRAHAIRFLIENAMQILETEQEDQGNAR